MVPGPPAPRARGQPALGAAQVKGGEHLGNTQVFIKVSQVRIPESGSQNKQSTSCDMIQILKVS